MDEEKEPELCTVAWAAELLGLSQRQVMRYTESGVLKLVRPKTGSRERRRGMLKVAQVREVKVARARMNVGPRP